MDLRTEILKEHSKKQSKKIADWIGTDQKRFAELMQIFLQDEYRAVQLSAGLISEVADRHPSLVKPWLVKMVHRMNANGVHVAVKRNVVRILQFMEIPEPLHASVMNTCFDFLADPKETVAVRCFSMTVLNNLAKTYPEIKQELHAIIEDALQHATTPGFKNRANKILNS